MEKEYTEEQLQAFGLIEKADRILFAIETAMKNRTNPSNNAIIFEIKQGMYDVQKFRRLLQRWKDLIELVPGEIEE